MSLYHSLSNPPTTTSHLSPELARLRQRKRVACAAELKHDVELSDDAGRFVCNYTLYRSLQYCQRQQEQQTTGRWHAVFVHVPSFDTKSKFEQLCFAEALLEKLRWSVAPTHIILDETILRSTSESSALDGDEGKPPLPVQPTVPLQYLVANRWRAVTVLLSGWLIWTSRSK